ncbi:Hypothetical protein R9X50_00654200 [Acrodontium crateriforme]|uniref:Rad60/SUMO-like domain-containing protein n=1 Tax=Acrodontium crateriforme TaxID=150365 RepID=A0AAQ3R9Z8_9PEZI|nr:Hypothetical protein R9X50_00654200 [Acrodontium crateriforme]
MSLFKRPAWAKAASSGETKSEDNIFSHSHSYQDIVDEDQRRKKEKAEKARSKDKQRSSDKQDVKANVDDGEGSAQKRRRITLEEGNDLLSEMGLSHASSELGNGAVTDDDNDDWLEEIPIRQTPKIKKRTFVGRREYSKRSSERQPSAVEIRNDSDSGDEIKFVASIPTNIFPVEEESDDEFAELARQARQRQLELDAKKQKSETPHGAFNERESKEGSNTEDRSENDPPIKLFLSSRIPNTTPLIVYRKLSQRLKDVRDAWCKRQGFSEDFANGVFLIHRMHRIYNVTSCKSLGLEIDVHGNLTMKGAEGKTGLDQIHIEAVTEEIYDQLKAEKARDELKRQGLIEPDIEEQEVETKALPESIPQEPIIKILLKAKNRDDFKLKVKPTTLFSKIMAASKSHFGVAHDKNVFLEFDGERLNPDADVQSTDIDDMDCIDVHIV